MKPYRFCISVFLISVLLCFCVSAKEADYKCGDNVTYSYDDKTFVLTISGSGAMYDYTTAEGGRSPWGDYVKAVVKAIVVEEGITHIGNYAFATSWNVKNISLPESLESIGDGAFLYCQQVETLIIPNKVKTIGEEAFRECVKLSTLRLPSSLESLKKGVISSCNALESLVVPEKVKIVYQYAFSRCNALKSVTFPKATVTFGHDSFYHCPNVTIYSFADSQARIHAQNYNIPFVTIPEIKPGLENFKKTNTYTDQFSDVSDADWFAGNVKSSYEYALMLGTSATEFSPKDNITVAQAITLAARIYSIYNKGNADFAQGQIWYQVYVDYCKGNGLLTQLATEDYTKIATREEVIMIFSSLLPKAELEVINSVSEIPDYKKDNSVIDFYRAGILTGSDENRSFLPNTFITRAEIATIVTRMIDPSLRVKY